MQDSSSIGCLSCRGLVGLREGDHNPLEPLQDVSTVQTSNSNNNNNNNNNSYTNQNPPSEAAASASAARFHNKFGALANIEKMMPLSSSEAPGIRSLVSHGMQVSIENGYRSPYISPYEQGSEAANTSAAKAFLRNEHTVGGAGLGIGLLPPDNHFSSTNKVYTNHLKQKQMRPVSSNPQIVKDTRHVHAPDRFLGPTSFGINGSRGGPMSQHSLYSYSMPQVVENNHQDNLQAQLMGPERRGRTNEEPDSNGGGYATQPGAQLQPFNAQHAGNFHMPGHFVKAVHTAKNGNEAVKRRLTQKRDGNHQVPRTVQQVGQRELAPASSVSILPSKETDVKRGLKRHFSQIIDLTGDDPPPKTKRPAAHYRPSQSSQIPGIMPSIGPPREQIPAIARNHNLNPNVVRPSQFGNTGVNNPAPYNPFRNYAKIVEQIAPNPVKKGPYSSESIARDILRVFNAHPDLPGLNSHLEILTEQFAHVDESSDLSKFRWDLVDSSFARYNQRGGASPPRKFPCLSPGCGNEPFPRQSDLMQHVQETHGARLYVPETRMMLPPSPALTSHIAGTPSKATISRSQSKKIPSLTPQPPGPLSTAPPPQPSAAPSPEPRTARTIPSPSKEEPRRSFSIVLRSPESTQIPAAAQRSLIPSTPSVVITSTPTHLRAQVPALTDIHNISPPGALPRKRGRPSKKSSFSTPVQSQGAHLEHTSIRNGRLPNGSEPSIAKASILLDQKSPKKRGRPLKYKDQVKVSTPQPIFFPFLCEWQDCNAKLINLETLRAHIHTVHNIWRKSGKWTCLWAKCHNKNENENTSSHFQESELKPWEFTSRKHWQAHIHKSHLVPLSWYMGDGPKSSSIATLELVEKSPWLYDAEGKQVTPSVENQKTEAGFATTNGRKRFDITFNGAVDEYELKRKWRPLGTNFNKIGADEQINGKEKDVAMVDG